ncbi:hypothetical protein ABPG77_008591 [Micractinium sp. CCAP 211/92]
MNQLPQAAAAPGGGTAEDASLDALRDCPEFMMAFGKVIPCGKAFPHDWSSCPFAHPTEGARRRDPRVHPHTGVSCPRLKKEGRCELGDSCPYAHSIFEYWLHPSRYRTQLCKDGGACKRWLCFFAHSLAELRLPDNKPCVPSEATMAALAATLAANTGVATEPPPLGAAPGRPGSAGAVPQHTSLDALAAAAQPAGQPQPCRQQGQGDAEVAQLVLRLLERGELSPEKAAALLRQLLPQGSLSQGQAAPPGAPPGTCAWEARASSEPMAVAHAPSAHQLPASLPLCGSIDGMAGHGWVPAAPSPQLTLDSAHLLMAQQGVPLPLGQQSPLHGALGAGPSQLGGTAAGRLMAMSGGAPMLASSAEAALLPLTGRSSFTTARSSSDAHAAAASSSAGTSPGRLSPPVLGSASSDADAATSLAAAVLGLHLPPAVQARQLA